MLFGRWRLVVRMWAEDASAYVACADAALMQYWESAPQENEF